MNSEPTVIVKGLSVEFRPGYKYPIAIHMDYVCDGTAFLCATDAEHLVLELRRVIAQANEDCEVTSTEHQE